MDIHILTGAGGWIVHKQDVGFAHLSLRSGLSCCVKLPSLALRVLF